MLDRIVQNLSGLPPLRLPHYSSPGVGSPAVWKRPEMWPALEQVVRISRSLTVRGYWITEAEFKQALDICEKHGASLAVDWQVFHRHFPADVPASDRGPDFWREFTSLDTKIEKIKQWLAGSSVKVEAFVLECERFKVPFQTAREANAAITARDLVAQLLRHEFPGAALEWYNRGLPPLVTGLDDGDAYSWPAYQPSKILAESRAAAGVVAEAVKIKTRVTAWIALGAEYRYLDQADDKGRVKVWDFSNKYHPKFAHLLGHAINHDEAGLVFPGSAWRNISAVVFHPSPLEPLIPDHHWLVCFNAYVRGACGLGLVDWSSPSAALASARATANSGAAIDAAREGAKSQGSARADVNGSNDPAFADSGAGV